MVNAGPLGILADDLTGAAEAAAAFGALGPTWVWPLPPKKWPEARAVLAVNGAFRELRPSAAAVAAAEAARALLLGGAKRHFLKMGSTARGLSGPVVRAVVNALGLDVAVVCLAHPKLGRSVVGGYCLDHGVPVGLGKAKTEALEEAHLPTALGPEGAHPVALLEWRTVAKGPAAVAQGIVAAVGRRCRVVVADAASAEDLAAVARGLRLTPYRVLPVGSVGLAQALAAELGLQEMAQVPDFAPSGPVLVVASSAHPTTSEQAARLAAHKASLVDAEISAWLVGEDAAVGRAGRAAAAKLVANQVALFWPAPTQEDVAAALATARALGMDAFAGSQAIAKGLGHAGLMALDLAQAVGVVVAGSDAAVGLALAGLDGPWRLVGPGPEAATILSTEHGHRPLRLALKGGAVGSPNALLCLAQSLGAPLAPV